MIVRYIPVIGHPPDIRCAGRIRKRIRPCFQAVSVVVPSQQPHLWVVATQHRADKIRDQFYFLLWGVQAAFPRLERFRFVLHRQKADRQSPALHLSQIAVDIASPGGAAFAA